MSAAEVVTAAVLPALSAVFVLAFARLLRGPTLPDRVVALELMSLAVIGVAVAFAVGTGQAFLLDVAAVVALISFLGTAAFAYYLERSG